MISKFLIEILIYLIIAIFFIVKSVLMMVEKKRIFTFMPWFVFGIGYSFIAALIFYGINQWGDDVILLLKLIIYPILLFIIWRGKWD